VKGVELKIHACLGDDLPKICFPLIDDRASLTPRASMTRFELPG